MIWKDKNELKKHFFPREIASSEVAKALGSACGVIVRLIYRHTHFTKLPVSHQSKWLWSVIPLENLLLDFQTQFCDNFGFSLPYLTWWLIENFAPCSWQTKSRAISSSHSARIFIARIERNRTISKGEGGGGVGFGRFVLEKKAYYAFSSAHIF